MPKLTNWIRDIPLEDLKGIELPQPENSPKWKGIDHYELLSNLKNFGFSEVSIDMNPNKLEIVGYATTPRGKLLFIENSNAQNHALKTHYGVAISQNKAAFGSLNTFRHTLHNSIESICTKIRRDFEEKENLINYKIRKLDFPVSYQKFLFDVAREPELKNSWPKIKIIENNIHKKNYITITAFDLLLEYCSVMSDSPPIKYIKQSIKFFEILQEAAECLNPTS